MTTSRAARIFAVSAGAGVIAAPLAFATPAAFATLDCGTGTEVSAGICEKAFTTPGDSTFTAPAGVTKLSAIIVGAGGGSVYNADGAYAGGGGEVVYVDSVSTTAAVDITVGAGGESDGNVIGFAAAGGTSSLGSDEAAGGFGASAVTEDAGRSGSGFDSTQGFAGWPSGGFTGAGGGASANAQDCYFGANLTTCVGGAGFTASTLATEATLFPALLGEPEFGMGGNGLQLVLTTAGDYAAGHGGDANGGASGNDGAVILRWAGSALPDTGMNVQPWMIGAGVATVAAGALFASGALRTRRRGRHSA